MIQTDDAYVQADIAAIAPKIQGYVERIGVTENQRVAAGEVIATLDDGDYRIALHSAQSAVATQKATLTRIAAQTDAARASVRQAEAQKAAAGAILRNADRNAARQRDLVASKAAPQARLDDAEAALDQARAGLAGTEAQIASAEAIRRGAARPARRGGKPDAGADAWRRSGAARSRADGAARALRRHGRQPSRRAGRSGLAGPAAGRGGAGRPALRRGELQGNPDRPASRPGTAVQMHVDAFPGQVVDRPGRSRRAGDGGAVLRAAAGERHRQLHQGGAAGAGAHRLPAEALASGSAAAGPQRRRSTVGQPHPLRAARDRA